MSLTKSDGSSSSELLERPDRKLKFLSDFAKLWNNPAFSDITLFLRRQPEDPVTYKFHAHQNIISLRTSYFQNATNNKFQEAERGHFHFETYDIEAVLLVFRYIYTGAYTADDEFLEKSIAELELVGSKDTRHRSVQMEKRLAKRMRVSAFDPQSWQTEHEQKCSDSTIFSTIQAEESQTNLKSLLRHLNVYILADMLLIHELRLFSTERLQKRLEAEQAIGYPSLETCIREVYGKTESTMLKRLMLDTVLKASSTNSNGGSDTTRQTLRDMLSKESFCRFMRESDFGGDLGEKLLKERVRCSNFESTLLDSLMF